MVEVALALGKGARRFLDVGCGSGAIAVTLQLETGAEVWGTDVSLAALETAAGNAARLGARVSLVASDLESTIADQSIDVLVSNPPYVPAAELAGLSREILDYEPHCALPADLRDSNLTPDRRASRVVGARQLILELATIAVTGCGNYWAGFQNIQLTPIWLGSRGCVVPATTLKISSPRHGCVLRVGGGTV